MKYKSETINEVNFNVGDFVEMHDDIDYVLLAISNIDNNGLFKAVAINCPNDEKPFYTENRIASYFRKCSANRIFQLSND